MQLDFINIELSVLLLLVDLLLKLGEVRLQALLDVLNRLKPVLLLKLNVLFNRLLLLIHELGDLLPDLLTMLLCKFESRFDLPLSVLDGLLFEPDHFLFLKSISIQVIVNLLQLIIEHDVKLLLRRVDDLVKLVLKSGDLPLIFFNLLILRNLNVLFNS